jgi:hypothetical protein
MSEPIGWQPVSPKIDRRLDGTPAVVAVMAMAV